MALLPPAGEHLMDTHMEEVEDEPNPFLSPPPPPLSMTMPPPTLPPRASTDTVNQGGSNSIRGAAARSDGGSTSGGSSAFLNDMGDNRRNPFAGPPQAQVIAPSSQTPSSASARPQTQASTDSIVSPLVVGAGAASRRPSRSPPTSRSPSTISPLMTPPRNLSATRRRGSGTNDISGSGTNNTSESGTNNVSGSGTNNISASGTNNISASGTNNISASGTNNISASGTNNASASVGSHCSPAPAAASSVPSTSAQTQASTHRRGNGNRSGGGGGAARSVYPAVVDPPSWLSAPAPPSTSTSTTAPVPVRSSPTATPTTAIVSAASVAPARTSATTSAGAGSGSSPGSRGSGSWSWGGLGRSLIGAVLGPGAIGEGGAASEAGVRRARAVRELTPHVMQQNADGKFSVSVWRKSKQDPQPVQVSVGVYDTAYEGQRAGEAFAPPKWQEPAKDSRCAVCDSTFGFLIKRRHHCRNCGRLVCSSCAETTWPKNMLPPTYVMDQSEKKVRVCTICYRAGENFRKALLSGSEEGAMAAYSTGCVNLRVPYTIYHNELPVHCAAAGGNLNILAWLVEDRCCPLFLDRAKKVALGDMRRLSVMGAAAAAGHIQIMRYLAFTQGCKVTEIRDMGTLWRSLEKCLYEGADVPTGANSLGPRRSGGSSPTTGRGGSSGDGYLGSTIGSGSGGAEVAAAIEDDDDSCIVCFERKVDCTLVPCGHHCCCFTCAAQFEQCPVCRADVTQKIRTISV